MSTPSNNTILVSSSQPLLRRFFGNIINRLKRLFEPEEVEVTFKMDGKNITYTYIKVEHKKVA